MLRWVDWKLSVAATMSFGCSSRGRELQTLQEIKRGVKSKKEKKEGVKVGGEDKGKESGDEEGEGEAAGALIR